MNANHSGRSANTNSSGRLKEVEVEVVLTQRAYCIITAQPVHALIFKVNGKH
jgi:hypothetical protein